MLFRVADARLEWQKNCARRLPVATLLESYVCLTKTLSRYPMRYVHLLFKFFGRGMYHKNCEKIKLFNIQSIRKREEEEIEFMSYSCFDISGRILKEESDIEMLKKMPLDKLIDIIKQQSRSTARSLNWIPLLIARDVSWKENSINDWQHTMHWFHLLINLLSRNMVSCALVLVVSDLECR